MAHVPQHLFFVNKVLLEHSPTHSVIQGIFYVLSHSILGLRFVAATIVVALRDTIRPLKPQVIPSVFQSLRSTSLSQKKFACSWFRASVKAKVGCSLASWAHLFVWFCGPVYAPNPNQTLSSCVATARPRGASSTDLCAFWEQKGAKRTRPVYMEVLEVVYGSWCKFCLSVFRKCSQ